jgi:hypothetical protein
MSLNLSSGFEYQPAVNPIDWLQAYRAKPKKDDGKPLTTAELKVPFEMKGMDTGFGGGRNVDLYNFVPEAGSALASLTQQAVTKPETSQPFFGTQFTPGAVPSPDTQSMGDWDKYLERAYQLGTQKQIQTAQAQTAADISAVQQLYPYISRAGAEATARNLAASQAFLAFKEGQPSATQARMQSAQAGEAEMMRAVGSQLQSAAQSPFGRLGYTGRTFAA